MSHENRNLPSAGEPLSAGAAGWAGSRPSLPPSRSLRSRQRRCFRRSPVAGMGGRPAVKRGRPTSAGWQAAGAEANPRENRRFSEDPHREGRVKAFFPILGALVLSLLAFPMMASLVEAQGLGSLSPDLVSRQSMAERENALRRLETGKEDVIIKSRIQDFDQESQTYILEGAVEIQKGPDFKLTADHVVYYRESGRIEAEGSVLLLVGKDVLSANRAWFNLETKRARLEQARGVLFPSLIVEAAVIEKLSRHPKTGQDRYYIERGSFTSCHRPGRGWKLHAREALVHVDKAIYFRGVRFQAWGIPLFYLPYWVQPISGGGRRTGFLPPRFGADRIYGTNLEISFFWAIARWMDATFGVRGLMAGRVDFSGQLRFVVSPKDRVNEIEILNQRVLGSGSHGQPAASIWRLTAQLNHKFPYGIDSRAQLQYQNEKLVDDVNTNIQARSLRFLKNEVNVLKRWGSQSLRLLLSARQGFGGDESLTQKLPSFVYTSGSPWEILGQALKFRIENFSVERVRRRDDFTTIDGEKELVDLSTFRVHFVPTLQGTLTLPGLSIEPSLSFLETWYSQRKTVDTRFSSDTFATLAEEPILAESGPGTFIKPVGSGLFRHLYRVRIAMTGPSFYRIYGVSSKPDGKLKHLIEPTVRYQYSPYIDEALVPQMGDPSIDLLGNSSHLVTYGLSNVLLYKWRGQTTAKEIARLDFRQTYRFLRAEEREKSPSLQPLGNIETTLQLFPAPGFSSTVRAQFDPKETILRNFSGNVRLGQARWNLAVDYFRTVSISTDDVTRHTASLDTTFRLSQRWASRLRGTYNILDGLIADSKLDLFYSTQCWGLSFGGGFFERKLGLAADAETTKSYSLSFSIRFNNLAGFGSSSRL